MFAQRARQIGVLVALALLMGLLAVQALRVDTAGPVDRPSAAPPTVPEVAVWRPSRVEAPPPVPAARPAERPSVPATPPPGPEEAIPPGLARVVLEIVDARGARVPLAELSFSGDCGRGRRTVTEGEGDLDLSPGACSFQAWRADGALAARSPVVDVVLAEGAPSSVRLVLPSARTGGLGVQIREHDEGIVVVRVLPGSPAAAAGLEAGDLIVEVDGVPTTSMSDAEFVSRMTGPEGTDVDFVIRYVDAAEVVDEPVVVTRAFLEG